MAPHLHRCQGLAVNYYSCTLSASDMQHPRLLQHQGSITRVPKISKEQLEKIVQNVIRKTNTDSDEFEELNLSGFSTLNEQIEFLKHQDRVDTMYIN